MDLFHFCGKGNGTLFRRVPHFVINCFGIYFLCYGTLWNLRNGGKDKKEWNKDSFWRVLLVCSKMSVSYFCRVVQNAQQ